MRAREVSSLRSNGCGYKELDSTIEVCIYCGLKAETLDHALPHSHKDHFFARERILVPSCHECNGLLSNTVQHTLKDRIEEAKGRLEYKYKKILASPDWSTEELLEMAPWLQSEIIRSMELKKLMQARIDFAIFTWLNLGRPEILLPR